MKFLRLPSQNHTHRIPTIKERFHIYQQVPIRSIILKIQTHQV